MQSRRMSLVEAVANVAIGYLVSLAANAIILPLFGFRASLGDLMLISVAFTAVSIARTYVVRRLFERLRPRPPAQPSPVFVGVRQAPGSQPELLVGHGGASCSVYELSDSQVKKLAHEAVNCALR